MKEKPEKIRMILAQNIKKRREYLGFSQEKLAEAADLSVQAINTIEGCRMWISDKSISRIAKALNVEIFQLFVPYHASKKDIAPSASSALIELRQNILYDTEAFCKSIDHRIRDALKNPSGFQNESTSQKNSANRKK